ncbi:TatD family hydrolase [Kiritimatiella glycovorans]|uniref:Deoxyribonuclease TatD n=1 Tax=Kiritimatiella glycovorans TaxID=1307763 RepID=A0A0G3EE61_9BACT|nr:TatD family hydrolase [Kiritimatiella glycovorans]AKJ64746.1 Deoxyribonuclease TatD [Kiritimatiella glycovorans]
MKLFDAHTHLQDDRLYPEREAVLRAAAEAGVAGIAVKGRTERDWERVAALADQYPCVHPSFGLHPMHGGGRTGNWRATLIRFLLRYPAAGIGETGLDFTKEVPDHADQESVFRDHLSVAAELGRPVTIHCRGAWDRLTAVLREVSVPGGMMIHCCAAPPTALEALLEMGAFISFSGTVTRPDDHRASQIVARVPLDRLLIETDAPDHVPCSPSAEKQLKPNEPARLPDVLASVASLHGSAREKIASASSGNARRFFGFES